MHEVLKSAGVDPKSFQLRKVGFPAQICSSRARAAAAGAGGRAGGGPGGRAGGGAGAGGASGPLPQPPLPQHQ